jgi:N-acetylmuramoyl-L-alanine amidase
MNLNPFTTLIKNRFSSFFKKDGVSASSLMKNTLAKTFALLCLPLLMAFLIRQNTGFNTNLTSNALENAAKGSISEPIVQEAEKQYLIKKVVIDAGHGGHDSGCHASAGVEKKNTLAIALKLGEKIQSTFPNVEIIYTRQTDVFIELDRRAEIANEAKADLFISIHCNSTDEGSSAYGTETYVLGMHKKGENFEVARRENASILLEDDYEQRYEGFDPYSNEAYIIFSLFQNSYLEKSILLAKFVEESLQNNAARRSLGVKQAGFVVLRKTAMPSVLIETGFLNHSREGQFLSSAAGQETIADALLLAFQKYKTTVETESVKSSADDVADVVFKIQLGTSSRDLSQTPRYGKIENLEVVQEKQVWKYFKTDIPNYVEATHQLKKVRAEGFSDAFVVAYKNGKRINLSEIVR